MTDLLSLANEIEAAEIGSRELDARICAAMRMLPPNCPDWLKNWGGKFAVHDKFPERVSAVHEDGKQGTHWNSAKVTTSADAALSLVPEGWRIIDLYEAKRGVFLIRLVKGKTVIPENKSIEAKTLPLAISAASLRALAQEDET